MKIPSLSPYEFVDAPTFNTAFNTVSGAIATTTQGSFPVGGVLFPEAMTTSFAGMTANVGLPMPFGLVTSGGVIVRAHGTLTNQDTQSYSVNFASLVPGSGTRTAFLAATVTQILQNPFGIPGPPPGHPSYNPSFIPGIGYASQVYSIAVSAVSGGIDNVNTFELWRTTLSAGQASISAYDTGSQVRATSRQASSPLAAPAGLLTVSQLQQTIVNFTSGTTTTLPTAGQSIGLTFKGVNYSNGNWVIACQSGDNIFGLGPTGPSITLPATGTVMLYADVDTGWRVMSFNNHSNNQWTGTNEFTQYVQFDGSTTTLGSTTVEGVSYFGTSGQFYMNPNNGGNQLLNFAGGQYIQFVPSYGFYWETGGSITIGAPGNVTINPGSLVTPNTVQGGYVHSTGTMRADGTLQAGGELQCNDIMNYSGTFYVAGNYNYYLSRNGSNGYWYFVENGTDNLHIGPGGDVYGRSSVGSAYVYSNGDVHSNGNTTSSNGVYGNFVQSYGDMNANGNMHCLNSVNCHVLSMDPGSGYSLFNDGSGNRIWNCTNDFWAMYWRASDGAFLWAAPGRTQMWIDGGGNLWVSGAINGDYFSDRRVKKNIKPYTRGLADLIQLEPIEFEFNGLGGSTDDGTVHYGLIAQDAQPFIPECIRPSRWDGRERFETPDGKIIEATKGSRLDGQLSLEDRPLRFALLNAVRELHDMNQALAARVAALEARLAA